MVQRVHLARATCERADGSCGPVDGLQGAQVAAKLGGHWLSVPQEGVGVGDRKSTQL